MSLTIAIAEHAIKLKINKPLPPVKVCNTISYTTKTFTITDNSKVQIDWKSPRPDGIGVINRRVYPRTGRVNFPDDREYPFWYYPDEFIIYWDNDRGLHTWKGGALSDCVDYNEGKKYITSSYIIFI